MTQQIEVRIPHADITKFDNEVLAGQLIMNRLRAAGVPVIGVLFPRGVEHGQLLVQKDDMFGEQVYSWSEI